MSSKKKTHGTRASQDDGRRKAEDVRAMETARELRARREAAQGPAPIDNELHRELPLRAWRTDCSLSPCSHSWCRVLAFT